MSTKRRFHEYLLCLSLRLSLLSTRIIILVTSAISHTQNRAILVDMLQGSIIVNLKMSSNEKITDGHVLVYYSQNIDSTQNWHPLAAPTSVETPETGWENMKMHQGGRPMAPCGFRRVQEGHVLVSAEPG